MSRPFRERETLLYWSRARQTLIGGRGPAADLILEPVYSIMLYMKTRVTFRVAKDLARSLRDLPNQTAFVESALRGALGRTCSACGGTGRTRLGSLSVSDFRQARLRHLDRDEAVQLQSLVRLARELAASKLDLAADRRAGGFEFSVERGRHVLLRGTLAGKTATLRSN